MSRYPTLIERLMARVVVDPVTGCHNWTGPANPKGYGRIKGPQHRSLLPHRVTYALAKGEIPAGLEIDHLCRNHACCNPDHLEAVTHAENVRRGNSGINEKLKTHCPQGHPYDSVNTARNARGFRFCRACKAADGRKRDWGAYKRARKAAKLADAADHPRKPRDRSHDQ